MKTDQGIPRHPCSLSKAHRHMNPQTAQKSQRRAGRFRTFGFCGITHNKMQAFTKSTSSLYYVVPCKLSTALHQRSRKHQFSLSECVCVSCLFEEARHNMIPSKAAILKNSPQKKRQFLSQYDEFKQLYKLCT